MKILTLFLALFALPAFAGENTRVEFSHAAVGDVLANYGKLIGKKIIADNTVQGQIDLTSNSQAVSAEAAATLIEKALFLNGLALIDASDDTVTVLGLGKAARSYGVPVYCEPSEIPKAERVFTYLLKLQNRDALEVAGALQQYIPPSNITSFTADPKSGAVLITGQTSVVRSAMRVIAAIDVAPIAREPKPALKAPEEKAQVQAERPAGPFILR